jgi:hypothetical protein
MALRTCLCGKLNRSIHDAPLGRPRWERYRYRLTSDVRHALRIDRAGDHGTACRYGERMQEVSSDANLVHVSALDNALQPLSIACATTILI